MKTDEFSKKVGAAFSDAELMVNRLNVELRYKRMVAVIHPWQKGEVETQNDEPPMVSPKTHILIGILGIHPREDEKPAKPIIDSIPIFLLTNEVGQIIATLIDGQPTEKLLKEEKLIKDLADSIWPADLPKIQL